MWSLPPEAEDVFQRLVKRLSKAEEAVRLRQRGVARNAGDIDHTSKRSRLDSRAQIEPVSFVVSSSSGFQLTLSARDIEEILL